MNEQNYASLEACQRLVKAGIVLETEAAWILLPNLYVTLADGSSPKFWQLISKDNPAYRVGLHRDYETIPAPSMAEVWRELPKRHRAKNFGLCPLIMLAGDNDETIVCYGSASLAQIVNDNPTDALIDLLIWVRKEKE